MNCDVLIRGDGCVGRALALALSRQGLSVALRGRAPAGAAPSADIRAYALNAASVRLLRELKVWDALPADARSAVQEMRVHGDQGAARLEFSAWQSEVDELAWIVDAAALETELAAALRYAPHVHDVEQEPQHALLALCEGREAPSRAALGLPVDARRYGHSALAGRLVSERPHQGVAWQWFRQGEGGPEVLALLPLERPQPGHSYALVWSRPAAAAAAGLEQADSDFEAELMAASAGAAGNLRLAGERRAWPLQWLRARQVCAPGVVLLGDCAHQVHPLSGQGLNLGLGDVAALTEVLRQREAWRPLGDAKLLRRYERRRSLPTLMMGGGADALWSGFAHSSPLVRGLRNQGLQLVNEIPPLKRWLARQAMG